MKLMTFLFANLTKVTFIWLVVVSLSGHYLMTPVAAAVCLCPVPRDLAASFASTFMVLRGKVIRQIPTIGAPIYFVTVDKVYKKPCFGSFSRFTAPGTIPVTMSNGPNDCRSELISTGTYLLMGKEISDARLGTVLSVSSCNFESWSNLSTEQLQLLGQLSLQPPSCNAECNATPSMCGANLTVPPCPNQSPPNVTCQYFENPKRCAWFVAPCPLCTKNSDCYPGLQYCGENGICRYNGTCSNVRDCYNPSNVFPNATAPCSSLPTSYQVCSAGRCIKACSTSPCPPGVPALPFSICSGSTSQCPNSCLSNQVCVNYNCGTCQAFCYYQ